MQPRFLSIYTLKVFLVCLVLKLCLEMNVKVKGSQIIVCNCLIIDLNQILFGVLGLLRAKIQSKYSHVFSFGTPCRSKVRNFQVWGHLDPPPWSSLTIPRKFYLEFSSFKWPLWNSRVPSNQVLEPKKSNFGTEGS